MYKKSGQRVEVLRLLRRKGSSTVRELAQEMGVVPVTMRAHLSALEREGLVSWTAVRGRIGRPSKRFAVTEAGTEEFPDRHAGLSSDLLEGLELLAGKKGVEQVLDAAAGRYAARHAAAMRAHTLEERVAAVAGLLRDESGLAGWERDGDRLRLLDFNCPYLPLPLERGEICRYHACVVSRLLGEPVVLERSIGAGDEHCVFTVQERPRRTPAAVHTLSDGRPGPSGPLVPRD